MHNPNILRTLHYHSFNTNTMQNVMQKDDVRDIAINCTDALEDRGLVLTFTDGSCWEVQDTIEEVLTKLLTERHGITVVNDRVK